MRFKLFIVFVSLMGLVFAAGGGKDNMSAKCLKVFKKYDRNGDHFLQRIEFDKVIKSKDLHNLKKEKKHHQGDVPAFSDVDTNKDKKLSESEFQVFLRYR